MSKSERDSDGFQKVNPKRCIKKKQLNKQKQNINYENIEIDKDPHKEILKIQSSKEDLLNTEYLESFLKAVSSVLRCRSVVDIICFGLGHISDCHISRYQLSILLHLKGKFNPEKVFVHDPIFTKVECEILQKLGLEVIKENREGNYLINDQGASIVYLPHCPKQLTNNFLWSNWSLNLDNCILICNSFTSLIDNQPKRILEESAPYVIKLFPYTNEIPLENNFKYTDIFNDTSVHTFDKDKLKDLSIEFWGKEEKPFYNSCEEFITSLVVEKLNI